MTSPTPVRVTVHTIHVRRYDAPTPGNGITGSWRCSCRCSGTSVDPDAAAAAHIREAKRDATLGPGCTCASTWHEATVGLNEPCPPGERRFPGWTLDTVDPDCIHHAHLLHSNLAADLRYGD